MFSFIPVKVFALSAVQNKEVTKLENEIFGFDYKNDDSNKRISRLEKNIYGKELTGDLTARVKKIIQDMNTEQLGKEITPSEDTYKEDELIADSSVNYPIIDEIELKIFNKTYKNRDFHTRIVTIERKLFGKIYDVEDYSTRMDRIKAEVVPERLAREKVFGYDNTDSLNAKDLSGLNHNYFATQMPYGQENYTRPHANYGEYTNDAMTKIPTSDIEDELAKLEQTTFGTEFSNDDTNTRIKRLNSAQKAKKTSRKYDSQKFNQRMSTAMEIGAMLLMILAMVL